ncbi:NAD(P)H-binding protein [Vibrio algicola]|uniref:NAD(P)H-binding protein n=1 Tax=Vibrio algicola TaxID=2662262 RepID=A0A5Q0TGY2_9VIBR|nr:NAD(P)H-binding protein [Vibrio algicola]
MKLLIIGATGLVGRHVLDLALADPRVTAIIAPTRRALTSHPKLTSTMIDFEQLSAEQSCWNVDAVICTLGTTIKSAGSKAAFKRVDHDYPLMVARLAHQHGASSYILNSALGANPTSKVFYNQIKGEVEQNLQTIGFDSLTFVQPGLIGGKRDDFRFGERILAIALTLTQPLLPKRWRISPASNIAQALLDSAVESKPGCHRIRSAQLAN